MARLFSLLCLLCPLVFAEVFYKETFDENWADRWVQSSNRVDSGEAGEFVRTAGKWYNDEEADKGIQTSEDARFYTYSSKIEKPFDSTDKDLVIQFSAKHEQGIDCGGGYIKVMPESIDQASFNGDSPYNIMFGPDICGSSTKKVHVIFSHDGENHLIKENIACENDKLTHVYTLIVHPDKTYEVRIDGETKREGKMDEDWDYELAKEISDPEASKPEDWVDSPMMDDPEDTKPENWGDEAEQIEDPESEKPNDWDDEADGDWEAPMIKNPEFKGVWKAKRIDNPDYKGAWEHPQIPNPDYVKVEGFGDYKSNAFVGFELWQVKAGTIFDNIFVGDSVEEAEAFLEETYTVAKDGEKEMMDKIEEAKREAQKVEREEKEAAAKAEAEAKKDADEEEEELDEDAEGEDDDEEGEDDDDEEEEADVEDEKKAESEGHDEL